MADDKQKKGKAGKGTDKLAKKKDSTKKKRKSPMKFIKEVIAEMKKVSWPSRKEWLNHTAIVAVFVVAMMVVVGLIDWGLTSIFQLIV